MRGTDDTARADMEWWESMLPPGWTLIGWTHRRSAKVSPPEGYLLAAKDAGGALHLDGRFLSDLWASRSPSAESNN